MHGGKKIMFQFLPQKDQGSLLEWGNETSFYIGMGVIGTSQILVRGETDINNL